MRSTAIVMSAVVLSAATLVACGGSGPSGSSQAGPGATAKAQELPARSGDVWEIDPAAPAEAQVLAYFHGLHTFVRADDDIFTATTRLTDVREDGSALVVKLDGGLEARLEDANGSPALRFSTGSAAALREHKEEGEGR